MREFINRALAIGLGIAAESKEQIERAVNELVQKGELSKSESDQAIQELIDKGEEIRVQLTESVKEKLRAGGVSAGYAMNRDISRIEAELTRLNERVASLEKQQQMDIM